MKKYLITALHKVLQELSESQLDTRLRQLDEHYGHYTPQQKQYMRGIYKEFYKSGKEAVKDDVFTDTASVTYREIKDRFNDYQPVSDGDWDFIEKLARGDQASIDKILKDSGQPGFENDFDYDIYHKYYIDGSRNLEEGGIEPEEDVSPEKVHFVSGMAYADGVGRKVWDLGSESIRQQAQELTEQNI